MLNSELLEKLYVITPEEQRILDGEKSINRSLYMNNACNIITSEKVLSVGKQIAIRPHTRFIHFPRHTHNYVEIVYMCKGHTTHVLDNDRIELQEGELLLLCQNSSHEILSAGVDDIAVNFIVRPEFFDNSLQMIGEEDTPLRSFILESLKNERASAGYLHYKVSNVLTVQNLLENLIYTLLFDTPNKRNMNQFTMGLLFLNLINLADKLVSNDKSEQNIVKILSYVEENYINGSLKDLSEKMHYDISALSREIKSKTGKNYTELVYEKRLSQACFLLKNTDMTIEEIAIAVGYKNVSFFYRIFREKYAMSPKKYRKL